MASREWSQSRWWPIAAPIRTIRLVLNVWTRSTTRSRTIGASGIIDRGRILVTGASGFIGRRVVAALLRESREVITLDHAWDSEGEIDELLGRVSVDACLHLGWYADPASYLVDVEGNLRSLRSACELVRCLERRGVERLIVAGSSAEYGESVTFHREDECPDPWSVYGAAKSSFRQLLQSSMRPESMSVAWVRIFNVTGPGESKQRVIPSVTRALLNNEEVALSSGDQRRDFLDVDDVASGLLALLGYDTTDTFNLCSGVDVRLRDLFEGIADRIGGQHLLRFGLRESGPHDFPVVVGESDKLRSSTGWQPDHEITAVIDRVVEYWRTESRK